MTEPGPTGPTEPPDPASTATPAGPTQPAGLTDPAGSAARRSRRPAGRVRWALAAAVLAVALAVAVWPRGGSAPAGQPAPANLSADRARAALPACTAAPAGSAPTATVRGGRLAGVRVTCLADGRPADLGALLGPGPALVNVWASWCRPCQQELPVLAAYAASAGAVRVVGVQVLSSEQSGLDLLAGLGVHLPTAFDGAGAAARALRLPEGLPASYVLAPDGSVILIAAPRVFTTPDSVRTAVARYLAGSGGR